MSNTKIKKEKMKLRQVGRPIDKREVYKPFPNEHACRLADPDDFDEFRRQDSDDPGTKPDFIFGIFIREGRRVSRVQARRYPLEDGWTESEARKDCEDAGGSFEAAEPEEDGESSDKRKGDTFIQRIEFPKDKFNGNQVLLWLSENGYDLKENILERNDKLIVEFDETDKFGDLRSIDMDVNQGIVAFTGPRKFQIKCERIIKQQAEKRLVTGVVMEPMVIDTDREVFDSETIERAAHRFIEHFRVINREHFRREPNVSIVESYIAPFDMTIGGQKVKSGSWIMTIRVNSDEIWEGIKSGEITGFSIEGFGGPAGEVFDVFDEAA